MYARVYGPSIVCLPLLAVCQCVFVLRLYLRCQVCQRGPYRGHQQLMIRSYELGVLATPELEAAYLKHPNRSDTRRIVAGHVPPSAHASHIQHSTFFRTVIKGPKHVWCCCLLLCTLFAAAGSIHVHQLVARGSNISGRPSSNRISRCSSLLGAMISRPPPYRAHQVQQLPAVTTAAACSMFTSPYHTVCLPSSTVKMTRPGVLMCSSQALMGLVLHVVMLLSGPMATHNQLTTVHRGALDWACMAIITIR